MNYTTDYGKKLHNVTQKKPASGHVVKVLSMVLHHRSNTLGVFKKTLLCFLSFISRTTCFFLPKLLKSPPALCVQLTVGHCTVKYLLSCSSAAVRSSPHSLHPHRPPPSSTNTTLYRRTPLGGSSSNIFTGYSSHRLATEQMRF